MDLLDEQATRDWAAGVLAEFGRVDGLVHLVGGWRGSESFTETDLADWDLLQDLLVRTLQHTSRAFHDGLRASDDARLVLVSTVQAQAPSATNAAYAAAKAAAEAWTLAVADSFQRAADAAAVILPIKALLTPAMREAKPRGEVRGYTDVAALAEAILDLWLTPATEAERTPTCGSPTDPRHRRCTTRRPAASPATTTPASTPRCSRRSPLANGGHQVAYGEDVYTARLQDLFRAALRQRRVGVPRLQRHRRERRRAAGDDRPLGAR